jgi:hypothetical protein
VPIEKCHTIMEKYGYTGSACIPMALDDAIELGKNKRGDLVVGSVQDSDGRGLRLTVSEERRLIARSSRGACLRDGDVEQATCLLDFRRDAIEAEAILKPCRYERG